MSNERALSENDLVSSLSQMAENTTAAELVRRQGQGKKVKVLSERKLMDWILLLLNQHLASKEDSFSDQEKEELLRKTQEELARRIKREQSAEAERSRIQAELQEVMAQISATQGDKGELDDALKSLKSRLEEVENVNSDLQQDAYDLQDQLQEKLNLLSSTIAEKDRLRDAVRNQMLRSNALVEGVLGLDATYYAGRHQDENPVADDASGDEGFYHDFDVGALIIKTLSQDLEKLRTITGKLGDGSGDQRSLEQDLDLLTQVKAGSLHAMDVAAPVSGLIEALAGTRLEAESLDEEIAHATGGQPQQISELPDADGDPAEVIAGATAVVRELASELARNRQRIAALKNLTDEADSARGEAENELEDLRNEHRQLLNALAAKAPADVAAFFSDENVDLDVRIAAVQQLATVPTSELEALHTELAEARGEVHQRDASLAAKQVEMDQALANQRRTLEKAAVTHQRAVARSVVEAARGDDKLADNAADLDIGLDADEQPDDDYGDQVAQAVSELTRRKTELEQELVTARASAEVAHSHVADVEHTVKAQRFETERFKREHIEQVAAVAAASTEAATAMARAEALRRELDEALKRVRVAHEEASAAKSAADVARRHAGEIEQSAKTQRVEAERIKRENVDHIAAIAAAGTETATAKSRAETLRRELDETQKRVRAAQEEADAAKAAAEVARRHAGEIEQSAKTQRVEAERVKRENVEHIAAIAAAGTETATALARVEHMRRELDQALTRTRHAQEEADVERAAAETAHKLISEVEQAAEAQRVETERLKRDNLANAAATAAASTEAATATARVEHMRREMDQALTQVRIAQEDADTAKASAHDAAAKARAFEVKHADRLRTDRVLAGELLQVAKSDDALRGVSTHLMAALDDSAEDQLQQQLTKTVTALAKRQQMLATDNSRLVRDGERLQVETGEAKRVLTETQRSIARTIIDAGKDDAELQESISQVEGVLERVRPGEPMPSDLLQTLNDAVNQLAKRKQVLQTERDEMAMHGKEIITALSATRDQREAELRDLRLAHDDTSDRLATIESRTVAAESANRHLAEALSKAALTLTLPADAEDARIDLELALSQLPDEGEEGIDVPADVAPQIAAHGARVAAALAARNQHSSEALSRAENENKRLLQELAERSAATGRFSNELSGLRKEIADARALHTATETHAANLRADLERTQHEAAIAAKAMAAARAEMDHASERHLAQVDELSLARAEAEGLKVRIANLDRHLNHSQAEIAEFNARGGASVDGLREDLQASRKELALERESNKVRESELLELREKSESAEARLKRLREEFGKRLEERDLVIQDKDRQLDNIADRRSDLTGLEAQVLTLTQQLAQSHTKINELEALTGIAAGATGRHTNVGAELKRTQADRDLLREQKRSLEADLAESASRVDELNAQSEQLRKEMLAIREQVEKTLHDERSKSTTLRDENGRLKADNVGLQQRIRKLSGN